MLTEYHKSNMRKHIAYLEHGAKFLKANFSMNKYDDNSEPNSAIQTCGTVGCSLGHAPYSLGILKMRNEYWDKYGIRVFGVTYDRDVRDYLFSSFWTDVNNTPEAAAARMKAVLYNQVPKNWEFTEEFAHPIVIEELESILDKSETLSMV